MSKGVSRRTVARTPRQALARLLLSRELGQRIPPVQELQERVGAGAGTVVKALRQLEDAEAVALESRGRLGTVVTSRHVGRLWEFAALGNLQVVMPPPGPIEQQGIAESLQAAMGRLSIPMVIDFRSGARDRLTAVFHEQAHIAATSMAAFHHYTTAMPGLLPLDLGRNTYYAPDSLVLVSRRPFAEFESPRIGIDRSSFDHEQLTLTSLDLPEATYVDVAFYRVPAAVLAGQIDAAVWHELPTVIPPRLVGLELHPLPASDIERTPQITHAALVTRALDAAVNAALRELRTADVAVRQRELAAQDEAGSGGPAFWPR